MDNLRVLCDFLKDRYNFELDRKDRITNNCALPISVFTVLSGAILYYFKNPIDMAFSPGSVIFIVFAALFLSSMGLTVYHIIRVFVKHGYGYIVSPKDIYDYSKEIADYARKYRPSDMDSYTEQNLLELMVDEYRNHGMTNLGVNKKRTAFLYNAKVYSFLSALLILPVGLSYIQIPRPDPAMNQCLNVTIKGGTLNVSRSPGPRSVNSPAPAATPTPAPAATKTTQGRNNCGGRDGTAASPVKPKDYADEPDRYR